MTHTTPARALTRAVIAALLLIVVTATGVITAAESFALRDGDRVVFYGDSITDQRRYTSFVETYVLTRFPKLDVRFVHSGWGGDRVTGGGGGPIDVRMWRDIAPYNPTVVTIMLGMNDGGYRAFDQTLYDTYTNGYTHIVETVQKQFPGVRITAIQPSAYDDVTRAPGFEGGYNQVLVRYGAFLKDLAHTQRLSLADLNTPLVATLTKANEIDPMAAARLIPDRVHPGEQIALVMAQALLKSWNAPDLVTEVEIDAARKTASVQTNTRVSELATAGGFAWTQVDEALPMPVNRQDPLVALVLKSSSVMEALNRQPLRVKGLARGTYSLRIDGEPIGAFSSEQLASGVNLAELATPMTRQAAAVHALTLQRTAIHNTRWRQLQVPLQNTQSPELLNAMGALDQLEARLIQDQRAAAQPRAHRFDLNLQ
jgi:lysophospholipase L1-like esterase